MSQCQRSWSVVCAWETFPADATAGWVSIFCYSEPNGDLLWTLRAGDDSVSQGTEGGQLGRRLSWICWDVLTLHGIGITRGVPLKKKLKNFDNIYSFQAWVGVSGPGWLWVPGTAGPAGRPEHAPPPQNSGAGGKPLHSCLLLPGLSPWTGSRSSFTWTPHGSPPRREAVSGVWPGWAVRIWIIHHLHVIPETKINLNFVYFTIFLPLSWQGLTLDWISAVVSVGKLKGIPDPLMGIENDTSDFPNYYVRYDFFAHQTPAATVAHPPETLTHIVRFQHMLAEKEMKAYLFCFCLLQISDGIWLNSKTQHRSRHIQRFQPWVEPQEWHIHPSWNPAPPPPMAWAKVGCGNNSHW